MSDPQTIVVKREGCGNGCLMTFAVLAVIGFAYEYWYISIPGLVVAGLVYAYVQQQKDVAQPAPLTPSVAPMAEGRWDLDPINPERERWREGDRWTDATRPREDWLPGEERH